MDILGIIRDEVKRPVGRIRETVKLSVEGAQDVRRKSVRIPDGVHAAAGQVRPPKVVLRENQDGTVGSDRDPHPAVPDLRKAPVKLSSVVIGNAASAGRAPRHAQSSRRARAASLRPSLTHVASTRQPIYFYYEVYDPAVAQGGDVKLLTSIAFFRGKTRTYETPIVEVTRVSAPASTRPPSSSSRCRRRRSNPASIPARST